MTKEQCLSIKGLNKKQIATIKRWAWESEKSGKEFKLESCKTEAEVVAMVNASFKASTPEEKQVKPLNLEDFSLEELEELMIKIPELIATKKAEKLAQIEEQIKELQAQKKELSK